MKTLLFFLLACVAVRGEVWEVVPAPKAGDAVKVDYRTHEEIQAGVVKLYEGKSIPADEHTRLMLDAPRGGRLLIDFESTSEAEANPRNYTVQVKDAAGVEVARVTGPNERPVRVSRKEPFMGMLCVDLKNPVKLPLQVKIHFAPSKRMTSFKVQAVR